MPLFAHNLTPEKIISRLPAGALLSGLLLGMLRMLIALTKGATISAETLTVYVLSGLNAGFLLAGMLAYFVLIETNEGNGRLVSSVPPVACCLCGSN